MIKKVRYNCFDVFFGKGWLNWVRMTSKDGTHWEYEKGDRKLTAGAAALLSKKLRKRDESVHPVA